MRRRASRGTVTSAAPGASQLQSPRLRADGHAMPSLTRVPKASAAALAVAALGLVAGCGGGSSSPSPGATAANGQVVTQSLTVTGPRDFGYVNNGLEATLRVEDQKGTLVLTNGRATRVGTPALYLIDLAGTRIDASLAGAHSLAPGAGETLAVSFPDGAETASATFFGLELGGVDAGGFTDG